MTNKDLQQNEYDQFRLFLEQQCGIVLGENKQYLVKSRLAPLMSRFNVDSLSELVSKTLGVHERQLRAAEAACRNVILEHNSLSDSLQALLSELGVD